MTQANLFDAAEAERPVVSERRKRAKQAFEKADAAAIEAYTKFLLAFPAPDFTAEEVSSQYKLRRDLPQPREWRALGHLYTELVTKGVIEDTGRARRRLNGNLTAVYRRQK